MRMLAIFLLVFALIASATIAAGALRVEIARSERFAKALTACANGHGFIIGRTVVMCDRSEVR